MDNLLNFPVKLPLLTKPLKDIVTIEAPRAIDHALTAERQLCRILANTGEVDDVKMYHLALLVAFGHIEDSIRLLEVMKACVQNVLEGVKAHG